MRRRPRTFTAAIVTAIAAAALVAGCGGPLRLRLRLPPPLRATASRSARNIRTPSSNITFSFTAPTRAGIVGKVIDSYSLSVTGPAGANCKGSHEQPGSNVAKGATENISVGPAQLGANWCVGPYTARVFEIQKAYCKPGVVCPQYIRVAGIVAKTSFSISR